MADITPDRLLELITWHEAGHTVAALHHDATVDYVKIQTFDNGRHARGGAVIDAWPSLNPAAQWTIVAAGVEAENVARRALKMISATFEGSDAERLSPLLRPSDFDKRFHAGAIASMLAAVRGEAREIIEADVELVGAIASRLSDDSNALDDPEHDPPRVIRFATGREILNLCAQHRASIKSDFIRERAEAHYRELLGAARERQETVL